MLTLRRTPLRAGRDEGIGSTEFVPETLERRENLKKKSVCGWWDNTKTGRKERF
jgi:hypothetical protein